MRELSDGWLDCRLDEVIADYNSTIESLWGVTEGGTLRSVKGALVERLTRNLVNIAWVSANGAKDRLSFRRGRHTIPLDRDYISRIPHRAVREYINTNIGDYTYGLGCDVQCFIGDQFAVAIECKAYVEVAMLKRVMVDAALLRSQYADLKFALLQLENFMGGDYGPLHYPPMGSPSAHTVMSQFDVNMTVITLLEGDRNIKRPIHREEFFKPLTKRALINAVDQLSLLF